MNKDFQTIFDGKKTYLFTLTNRNGMQVSITNFGGKIVSIRVPDRQGKMADVVLGYDNIKDYIHGNPFFGALVGRYANRIAHGGFALDGKIYRLNKNDGNVHLHGGKNGFHNVVWEAKPILLQDEQALELRYLSRDGEENYPGNLNIRVVYRLTRENALKISFEAETDRPTIINLTNHSFFNLAGEGNGTILDHEVFINADRFTPVKPEDMTPTGALREVAGTSFDFRKFKPVGQDIEADNEQLRIGNGYDHNFVLNKETKGLSHAATACEPLSGRVLEVWTDQPGMQFYTSNFLDEDNRGKAGKVYQRHAAFCFETQHFPDSPNHSHFPSTVLRPGERFSHNTVFKFYTR